MGCKPCALILIKNKYIEEAKTIIKGYNLPHFLNHFLDNWHELWIYKKSFMLEVIKALPDTPQTTFDHWVLGKAFGYSDEAIEEFLNSSKGSSVTTRTGG